MDTELIPLRQSADCHLSFAKARLKWIRNQSLSVSFSAATSPLRRRGFSNPHVHPCLAFQGEVATSVAGEVCFNSQLKSLYAPLRCRYKSILHWVPQLQIRICLNAALPYEYSFLIISDGHKTPIDYNLSVLIPE